MNQFLLGSASQPFCGFLGIFWGIFALPHPCPSHPSPVPGWNLGDLSPSRPFSGSAFGGFQAQLCPPAPGMIIPLHSFLLEISFNCSLIVSQLTSRPCSAEQEKTPQFFLTFFLTFFPIFSPICSKILLPFPPFFPHSPPFFLYFPTFLSP